MSPLRALLCIVATVAGFSGGGRAPASPRQDPLLEVRPDALVDLRSEQGVRRVEGQWRIRPARIVEVASRGPGPDLRASGHPNRTHDLEPRAGSAGFDDSGWETIAPEALEARRGSGKLSFLWYRTRVTVPRRVGRFDPRGAVVLLEVVVDDAAEVWVNGRLRPVLGQVGGAHLAGFNAPNRVILTRNAQVGQQFQIAILGINGPLSSPPSNFIWVRSATLAFYRADRARVGRVVEGRILRKHAGLDEIVPSGAKFEKVAGGFTFTEGPVWSPGGYLLFSVPNSNIIYRWTPDGLVFPFRTNSGYTGVDIGEYTQPGSNGLTFDGQGRLTIAEMGNRRVTRIEKTGAVTVLADRYRGKRLNSPNDLVYRSDGSLYFTDPPFGLPKFFADPRRELPYSGVFRVSPQGGVQLVAKDLAGPNGLAFSPDEKWLYVGNWDPKKKVVMRYPVSADGTLGEGMVLFDMTSAPGDDAIDGIKVDRRGNLYVTGPGGLWILSPQGKHLGTLQPPEAPHNIAWGDADGRTLYITALTGLYRIRLNVAGIRPAAR